MIELNLAFVVQIINFGILVLVLNMLMVSGAIYYLVRFEQFRHSEREQHDGSKCPPGIHRHGRS